MSGSGAGRWTRMYPAGRILFDNRRCSSYPVAPGRWPVRATLHPIKGSARAFNASCGLPCLNPRSSLRQPATQARRMYRRSANANFTGSGAVSTSAKNVAITRHSLVTDSFLLRPTERKATSYCTLALVVICLTSTCALISTLLVKLSSSIIYDYDVAGGRTREPSLRRETDVQVPAENASGPYLERRDPHGKPGRTHHERRRSKGAPFSRTAGSRRSREESPLFSAATSSKALHRALGDKIARVSNVTARSAIEHTSGTYVKQATKPNSPTADPTTYFLDLATSSAMGRYDSLSTTVIFTDASVGSKLSSNPLLSEASNISRTSPATSLPKAFSSPQTCTTSAPLISADTAGFPEKAWLVVDATKGSGPGRSKTGQLQWQQAFQAYLSENASRYTTSPAT
ncbi:uncharacterized protein [Dermacentor albipictus]|uniref:uncharacterized protein n=1 Tax=Dermacentor albipictus TaxID=60249 RepID=UPI0031FCC39D